MFSPSHNTPTPTPSQKRKLTFDELLEILEARTSSSTGVTPLTDILYITSLDLFAIYNKQSGAFELKSNFSMDKFLYNFCLELKQNTLIPPSTDISASFVESLRKAMRIRILKSQTIEDISLRYIACEDETLDLQTFTWLRHDRKHHSFLSFPRTTKQEIQNTNPTEDCPNFIAFLHEILTKDDPPHFSPDYELIDWFQLFLGALLTPSLSAQAAFFLVGQRAANGKSTLMDVVIELFTSRFCSFLSLQELTTSHFALGELRGKLLNISDEEESKYVQTALFKKLVTGSLVQADVKFGERIVFKPKTKFVFLTNAFPTLKDYDQALKRRIYIIPFHRSFQKDPNRKNQDALVKTLTSELSGILGFAIEGAKRLKEDFDFVLPKPKFMRKAEQEMEAKLKSSFEFFEEFYEVLPENEKEFYVSTVAMYEKYTQWCEQTGAKPMRRQNFLSDIFHRYEQDGLSKGRKRFFHGGERFYVYFGIREKEYK